MLIEYHWNVALRFVTYIVLAKLDEMMRLNCAQRNLIIYRECNTNPTYASNIRKLCNKQILAKYKQINYTTCKIHTLALGLLSVHLKMYFPGHCVHRERNPQLESP